MASGIPFKLTSTGSEPFLLPQISIFFREAAISACCEENKVPDGSVTQSSFASARPAIPTCQPLRLSHMGTDAPVIRPERLLFQTALKKEPV